MSAGIPTLGMPALFFIAVYSNIFRSIFKENLVAP